MGIKKFKEKFKIEHIVHMDDEGLHIGSPYITSIITISKRTGEFKYKSTFGNDLMKKYPLLFKAATEEIIEAINAKDEFSPNIPIYSVADGVLREDFCEEFGFPNTTQEGRLIFDNVYFKSKEEAVAKALKNSKSWLSYLNEREEELKGECKRLASEREKAEEELGMVEGLANEIKK